jgi:hypothetical protein
MMMVAVMMIVVVTMVDAMTPVGSECRSSRRRENHSKKGEADPLHSE